MARHYKIEGKKIIVNLTLATDEEFKAVERFKKLDYEIVTIEEEKAAKKSKTLKLTEEYIKNYLEKNDPPALETYEQKKNEPVKDENGQIKTRKSGKPVTKGFINARTWFKSNYLK